MTNRNLAFAGAALLAAGLFTPVVTLPFLGSVNLFNNGSNEVALVLLALAAGAAGLAAKDREGDALWPGAAAAVILLYLFVSLQYRLSALRQSIAGELKGNPFASLAEGALGSIQLQWGWLVLGAGAGLIVYAAVTARKAAERATFQVGGTVGRAAAGLSLLAALFALAWDLSGGGGPASAAPARESADASAPSSSSSPAAAAGADLGNAATASSAGSPDPVEAAYIRDKLRLYDLQARYYESVLDGEVPGVRFKIKNGGDRTLDRVTVRVVFHDAAGVAIAEQEYNPVLVSEYSYGGDNKPLRPNYIWQGDRGEFYSAKDVPSEWAPGKATATITDIEFAAPGKASAP
jgi:hypothetical protein